MKKFYSCYRIATRPVPIFNFNSEVFTYFAQTITVESQAIFVFRALLYKAFYNSIHILTVPGDALQMNNRNLHYEQQKFYHCNISKSSSAILLKALSYSTISLVMPVRAVHISWNCINRIK